MAVYNIVGKLEVIGQPVPIQGRNGTFYKRDVVLDCSWYSRENGEKYDNHPIFEFVGDQVNIPAMYQVGMKVTISFVIQGNSSDKDGQRSYFNKLVGKNVVPYQPYQQGQGGPTNYPQQGGYGQGFNPGYQGQPYNGFPQQQVPQSGYQPQSAPMQTAPQPAPAPFPPQVDPVTGVPVEQQDNADDLPF